MGRFPFELAAMPAAAYTVKPDGGDDARALKIETRTAGHPEMGCALRRPAGVRALPIRRPETAALYHRGNHRGRVGLESLPSATARRVQVAVRIEVREAKLREKVKAAGGRWDPQQRVWHLPMEQVLQLGLESRVAHPAQPGRETDAY